VSDLLRQSRRVLPNSICLVLQIIRASAIVKADYPFGRIVQVCDYEAHSGEQLSMVPLHLRYHSSRNIPTLGLVDEVVIGDEGLRRRSLEVTVVGCSLLLTVRWTLGTVHIQDYSPVLSMDHGTLHPLGIHLSQALQVLLLGSRSPVSNRPIPLAIAALWSEPEQATTTRIAGSLERQTVSLVSS